MMNKERIKEFLMPTFWKIILFLILMVGLNCWIIFSTHILDARILVGLPLPFYPIGSFMIWSNMPPPPIVEFSWINFVIDIIFWYVVSCLIVFIYSKFKSRKI